jgi:hypothetical protein
MRTVDQIDGVAGARYHEPGERHHNNKVLEPTVDHRHVQARDDASSQPACERRRCN